jgi:hypothetical protein
MALRSLTAGGFVLSSLTASGIVLALAVYVLILAGYLIFSPSMRAVFRKSKAWNRSEM